MHRVADNGPKVSREHKKLPDVGEDGSDENVRVQNTIREGEHANKSVGFLYSLKGLGEGRPPNVIQGDIPADGDAQVDTGVLKREVGPRGGPKRILHFLYPIVPYRGDDSGLILVNA